MNELLCDINQSTQPIPDQRAFNNWNIVSKGWYAVCPSKDVKNKKVRTFKICGHQIIIYRGEGGKPVAMDAFCPHMGMNLVAGTVIKENIKCVFHEWTFNSNGECIDIPCQSKKKHRAKSIRTYPATDAYGLIWVFSDEKSNGSVPVPRELEGEAFIYSVMQPFKRIAHPHVTMMNSIDEQHMRSVHKLPMHLNLEIDEIISQDRNQFEVKFEGRIIPQSFLGKIQKKILGDVWKSKVTFIDGCIGILTIMIDAKMFGKISLPVGQFVFSQTFIEKGKTVVWPIVVTKKYKGFIGLIYSYLVNRFFKLAMWYLAFQDGRLIYKDLRFNSTGLLADLDHSSIRWISFTNRAIRPSVWSKSFQGEVEKNFDENVIQ